VIAIVGAGLLYLAAREGSFAGGGAVIDHKLAEAGAQADAQTAPVIDKAGAMAEQAGDALTAKGQAMRNRAAASVERRRLEQPVGAFSGRGRRRRW
jgi:hypothetical protein